MGDTIIVQNQSPVIREPDNPTIIVGDQKPSIDIIDRNTVIGNVVLPIAKRTSNYLEKNADYYPNLQTDFFIAVDCSNGDVNIFLPLATLENRGEYVTIKKIDSTSYTVTVHTSNGQTIDLNGSTSVINSLNDAYIFTSTGSGFQIS